MSQRGWTLQHGSNRKPMWRYCQGFPQKTNTCSKSAIETLQKDVRYVQS